eukprot:TRINITY_DN31850_c0_g1_i1.p1 TRINITY_DN31850_c0_g1~~TRINITY_DN31850_c0_g1_i1.p1  ORF type:complete len:548 (+),score=76.00 TRINITY_DN31850_c0_g1_i1:162-1805(+)
MKGRTVRQPQRNRTQSHPERPKDAEASAPQQIDRQTSEPVQTRTLDAVSVGVASGFAEKPGGHLKNAFGGGVKQKSTSAFFTGLEDADAKAEPSLDEANDLFIGHNEKALSKQPSGEPSPYKLHVSLPDEASREQPGNPRGGRRRSQDGLTRSDSKRDASKSRPPSAERRERSPPENASALGQSSSQVSLVSAESDLRQPPPAGATVAKTVLPPLAASPGAAAEAAEQPPDLLRLRITTMSVQGVVKLLRNIDGRRHWTCGDAMKVIQGETGIPVAQQRLFSGSSELQPSESLLGRLSLGSLGSLGGGQFLVLRMARRHPDCARWLERVKRRGLCLSAAASNIRNSRDVALAAVRQNGRALQFLSENLRADKDIVTLAVENDGYALRYAMPSLKNNKDVVMAAVGQNGLALNFVGRDLVRDEDIVMKAAMQNSVALQFVDADVRSSCSIRLPSMPRMDRQHSQSHQESTSRSLRSTGTLSSTSSPPRTPRIDDGRWPTTHDKWCPTSSLRGGNKRLETKHKNHKRTDQKFRRRKALRGDECTYVPDD